MIVGFSPVETTGPRIRGCLFRSLSGTAMLMMTSRPDDGQVAVTRELQ